MPELNLDREVLGWLIAARTGHGHFADTTIDLDMKKSMSIAGATREGRDCTLFLVRMQYHTELNCLAEQRRDHSRPMKYWEQPRK